MLWCARFLQPLSLPFRLDQHLEFWKVREFNTFYILSYSVSCLCYDAMGGEGLVTTKMKKLLYDKFLAFPLLRKTHLQTIRIKLWVETLLSYYLVSSVSHYSSLTTAIRAERMIDQISQEERRNWLEIDVRWVNSMLGVYFE